MGPAILGLCLAALLLAGQQLDYLNLTAAPLPIASSTPEPTPTGTPSPVPTASPAPVTTSEARASATPTPSPTPSPTPRAYGEPVRLLIPRIGVDAPVVKVGLAADGQLQAPSQAHQVGWYAKGTRPGQTGNALFDGHLDWIRSAAVFYHLGKVEVGDEVIVVTADGEKIVFLVEWKALYEASKAPMDIVFGPTAGPTVTLITCGGQFDRTSQSYTHRWVVRAKIK